jgi:prepilin-type N-terminal cleavage/methylation domain-containing protein
MNIIKHMSISRKQNGFTLVELMVVVAVIGILVAIAVPQYVSSTEAARVRTDMANVRILNGVTVHYAVANNISGQDIFNGFNTDSERIDQLVSQGFLAEEPQPQQKDTSFVWNIESQKWQFSGLIIVDNPLTRYIFSKMNKSDFIFNTWSNGGGSTWSINGTGLQVTGTKNDDQIFFGNNKSYYTLDTTFRLNENSGEVGGLGIFFETTLNGVNQNRDTGYILQFDRGFSEIVLRKRVNGYESSTHGGEILFQIGNRGSSTIKNKSIPYKTNSDWWESDKKIVLTVSDSGTPGKKNLTVLLDGAELVSDFLIDSEIEPEYNHSGFRAWNNQPATIYEMTVK